MKKLWQFLSIVILTLALAGGALFSESKPKSKVRFFAPGSLYIYILGSFNHFAPPLEHSLSLGYESANAFAPVFGVGYRVVNVRDKFFLSLEGDFSPATYNFDYYARDQKISILTIMLNAEAYFSSRFPMIVFGGIGIGSHQLTDLLYEDYWGDIVSFGDDNILVLALDLGIKIPISKRLLLRVEYQWNGKIYSDGEYYDEYLEEEVSNTRWDFLSSSFSVGIELHF